MWIIQIFQYDRHNRHETKIFKFTNKENAEIEYKLQIIDYFNSIDICSTNSFNLCFLFRPANMPIKEFKELEVKCYLELIELLLKYDNIVNQNKKTFSISLTEEKE